MVRRFAFTMIELIFAIVIIAITVISLPMMSQTVSKGIESNIVQEAIFASAAELNQIVTARWDENSIEVNMPDSASRVIETTINMCENDSNSSTFRQMAGHINQPLHRRCLDANTSITNSSTIGSDSGDLDDIDDGNGVTKKIYVNNAGGSTAGSSSGYKNDYNITTNVTYSSFGPAASTNIKKVQVSVKDGTDTITSLVTYSANIGEVDYYKRSY